MRTGILHKSTEGWLIKYNDYQTKPDGTAYGSPVERSRPIDPNQVELCESLPTAEGRTVSFEEIRLWKIPEGDWVKTMPADKSRHSSEPGDFAQIRLNESEERRSKIEAEFIETLREFAWEVWKASAKSDDQSRDTFDKFYTDLSNS
jgi:hypothetical protein